MSIKNLMSSDVVSINIDSKLEEVRDIFNLVTFHHILVVDYDKTLVGVISDRDFFKAIGPRLGTPIETEKDLMVLNKKAHQIMNRRVVSVNIDAKVIDVVSCFHKQKVSCVPVVDNDNIPVGIISWRDIMDALALNMLKKQK